jgi:DNA polymerase
MRMVENAIQGIARDIMVNGILEVEQQTEITPIGCIHDELLGLGPETLPDRHLKKFCKALCTLPDWAKDVPIQADGWYGKRFRK